MVTASISPDRVAFLVEIVSISPDRALSVPAPATFSSEFRMTHSPLVSIWPDRRTPNAAFRLGGRDPSPANAFTLSKLILSTADRSSSPD